MVNVGAIHESPKDFCKRRTALGFTGRLKLVFIGEMLHNFFYRAL